MREQLAPCYIAPSLQPGVTVNQVLGYAMRERSDLEAGLK